MGTPACTNSCAPAARVMHAHIHHVSYTLRIAAHAPPRARAHLVLLIDDAVEGAVNVVVAAQPLPAIKDYMSHATRHTSHVTRHTFLQRTSERYLSRCSSRCPCPCPCPCPHTRGCSSAEASRTGCAQPGDATKNLPRFCIDLKRRLVSEGCNHCNDYSRLWMHQELCLLQVPTGIVRFYLDLSFL